MSVEATSPGHQSAQQKRVLVIDDDCAAREALSGMLGKLGWSVLTAPDGVQGVEQFERERPDLVITELLMPEKEGLQTILEIRRASPKVGIVAISAGGRTKSTTFLDLAKKMGANGALKKPILADELEQAIRGL